MSIHREHPIMLRAGSSRKIELSHLLQEHHIRSKRRISVHTRHRRPCHVQSLAQSQSNGVSSCQADGIPCSQHPCCREVGQGTWQCGDTSAASTNRMMGREYWEDFSKSMNRMMSSIFNG
ncbi:hypothetical protein TCAL_05856 [Tigriopus californicus]|uniref:Uncharacterized protein n=1 Tax=Tigriopus californicus TaxID=6832 RepID=A0A553N8Z4_TIGCA|nr:hypothetical protein TCAL_05856 [Tigriopus californicus]